MRALPFQALPAKLFIGIFLLLGSTMKINAQTCAQDQASFKKISDTLQAARKGIQKNTADLAYIQKLIKDALDESSKLNFIIGEIKNDAPKVKMLTLQLDEFVRKTNEFKKRETEIKKDLKYYKNEETILVNSFHLVRDRMDRNHCPAAATPSKNKIPDVTGTYNSPFGKTVLTMGKGEYNVPLTAVVYYDKEGTSTLKGRFDGVHWTFTWKNTFKQFGTGDMILQSDESFSGYYVDKSTDPQKKGYWWLRPKQGSLKSVVLPLIIFNS